ncbi:MAG: DNA alkylation repair protein [Patescibacteria group bacterium]
MQPNAVRVIRELRRAGSPKKAKLLARFFRTGKGEYGEGDVFAGVMVPESRKIAKRNQNISFSEIQKLLSSPIHEARLIALLILVWKFEHGNASIRAHIYHFYLSHSTRVNNWDLVDLSAHKIVGEHLVNRSREPLYRLAKSKNLWEKRIAIISTFAFLRRGEWRDSIRISEKLLDDPHDLIHKAVGWVLREVGKQCSESALERFLKAHGHHMPRTALRYAIERFPEKKRRRYLTK